MGLELDETEHHLRAGPFKVARPLDVGFLVETGLELDQRHHRLAGLRGLGESRNDGAVARGAVERLLDRHHVRIGGGLADELHHHVERLVRVVDDQILLADGGEAVAAVIADALGKAGVVGLELQVRPLVENEQPGVGVTDEAGAGDDHVVGNLKLARDEPAQLRRAARVHLHADHHAATAALQRGLEELHEIFGFFLDLDVAVANDPEQALTQHFVAGKQPGDREQQQVLQRQEARARTGFGSREPHEALELRRYGQKRVHVAPVALVTQLDGEEEPAVGDERKRVGGVDGDGRHHRQHLVKEQVGEPRPVGVGEIVGGEHHDPAGRHLAAQLMPAGVLFVHQFAGEHQDAVELLAGGEAVLGNLHDALAKLAGEARHAHHQELVEVVAGDRQEPQPLEQRVRRIAGLLQHTQVEAEPRQLAVDEAGRAAGHGGPGSWRRGDLSEPVFQGDGGVGANHQTSCKLDRTVQ